MDLPATNYVIVGRKVSSEEGVIINEKRSEEVRPRFLAMTHYRHADTGSQWDVATRPGDTVDIIPWFVRDGELHVVARSEFPRPITQARGIDRPADDVAISGYIPEPISVVVADGRTIEETVVSTLAIRAHIERDAVLSVEDGPSSMPSPGATAERVRVVFVGIAPPPQGFEVAVSYDDIPEHRIKEFSVSQLIRAYKSGGMVDVRLEIAAYALLERLARSRGPWIEQVIALPEQTEQRAVVSVSWEEIGKRLTRQTFTPITAAAPSYVAFMNGTFSEYSSAHKELRTWEREYIVPRHSSTNTVTVVLVTKTADGWYIAVEESHLAPVQALTGSSGILTVPAWRLPKRMHGVAATRRFIEDAMRKQFSTEISDLLPLGGSYYPSAGLSPEYVMPFIAYVPGADTTKLTWIPLSDLFAHRDELLDGHLLVSLWRTLHMISDMAVRE